jgi:paraquat-inducible protein B
MPDLPNLPEAHVKRRARWRFDLIWLVPLVAALIGGWLAVRAILERGPTVTISFQTAEGLEPGKTYISYKDVKIGLVKKVSLSVDRSRVDVTAEFSNEAAPLLVEDTRFWVVRPRFAGGQLSGLSTLLAGEHIELDVGKSKESSRQFTGLEVAPVISGSLPGRSFLLRAADLGSLDVGSPIYYRRLKVGQVDSFDLEKDGSGVSMKIFVQAPYDRYVTPSTRFWNASGVDLTMDANGLRLQTQSLVSVLVGGLAFETPPGYVHGGSEDALPAKANASFLLHGDRAAAMKAPDGEMQVYLLNFRDSLRGLVAGAPLDFRGIVVGEVLSTSVEYDPEREWFNFPVYVALYPERIQVLRHGGKSARKSEDRVSDADLVKRGLLKAMIERGFRAQLRTGSLLTGQLYVALDFFQDAKKVPFDPKQVPPEVPTVPGDLEDLQQSLKGIAKSLAAIKFDKIGAGVEQTLENVNRVLLRFDQELAPELKTSLQELQRTLKTAEKTLSTDSPVMGEVKDAAHEISRAAQSLRSLADLLDRQPDALLKGKQP